MNRNFLIPRQCLFFAVAIVLATLLGLALPDFLRLVVAWGHKIPQPDLEGDYVTAFIWAVVLGLSIFLWPVPAQDKRILLNLWLVRCSITLGFMLFYENYYGLDAYVYFSRSIQESFFWEKVGLGAGTANTIALCWMHNQVFPATYHSLKVSFSLLGLISVYLFYRSYELLNYGNNHWFLYVIGVFPSILFWSSILGKEPIVLLGIAFYVFGVVAWAKYSRIWFILFIVIGITLAMFIRVWLGPILLFPLIIFAWGGIRGTIPRLMFVILAIAAFAFTFNQFNQMFGLSSLEDAIETTNQLGQGLSHGGSAQDVAEFTSFGKMIAFAPMGIFTALFRPLPGEVLNPFGLVAGIENLLLLILCGKAVTQVKSRILHAPIIHWAIMFVLTWSIVYGFISSRNLGAGVRFKLQILPIFLTLIFIFINKKYDFK